MAEIRVNATGGLKLFDADDSHYAQIVAGTITSNVDAITLGHNIATFNAAITAGGVLKTDDATEATSTTDGSLQTDGGLSVVKDAVFGDDVKLLSDSSVIAFGADGEVTLTHVHNDGLLLNSDNQLQFRDSAINIRSDADGDLDINADDEIELNSTLIDINGNVEISGTATTTGVHTFSATPVFPDGSLALADLDIDGGTEIGAAIVDADLFIIDDGAGGTNRKCLASRIKTYAGGAALANDANNRVVTGDGSGGLNGEANLTFDGNALVVAGTAPSITIGDAGAEDTKIVFDGNAQDFHIGLDDSADDLVIGLGSTLGTTSHIVIDEAGHVSMPLQSAFCAHIAGSDVNQDASAATVVYGTERFDLNADYGSNTFTAPVTGKYLISASIVHQDIADQYIEFKLKSSNRDWTTHHETGGNAPTFSTISVSCLIDMDASDTVYVTVDAENDTDWNIRAGQGHFAGYLVA